MITLNRLARLIDAELVGDPEAVVSRAQSFESAGEGDVTFATDAAYLRRLEESDATAIILKSAIAGSRSNLLLAPSPKLAFARALQILHGKSYRPRGVSADLILGESTVLGEDSSVHPRVTVGSNTNIGNRVTLHSGVVIGNRCSIGDDTVIHANVSIYDDCQIGKRVIIHSGTVIGSDGFGFVVDNEGRQVKVLQLGRVVVEDDCEIGANCAIDRGGFGDTILQRGVKLDNLIQVGHNTLIGEDTVVAALTGFSGGTRIGRRCTIAGQVGTNQHIKIGDDAVITARSGVTKSVPAKAVMGGTIPAQDYNAWRRCQVLYSRLPQLAERLRRLERMIQEREEGGEK